MDNKVTVSVRSMLLAGLVLIALVAAYLMGGGGEAAPRAAAADQPRATAAKAGTLTMVGKGEASAVPDQLSFALAVKETRPELESALDVASRTTERVLASLTKYGVKRADVQTTGLSMYPVYDYHDYGPPTLRGYKVSQRARVLVTDLGQGGKAVSAAVGAGANAVRVTDIKLQIGDTDAVLEKARDAAVDAATTKAEQYAAATGQELGDVLTLREVSTASRSALKQAPYNLRGTAPQSDAAAALPVRAGKDDLGVTVQVVWEFE